MIALVTLALAGPPAGVPEIRADGPRDPAPVQARVAELHEPIVMCVGASPATLTLTVEPSGSVSSTATGSGAACLQRLFDDWALPAESGDTATRFVIEIAERRGLGNRAGYVGPPPNLVRPPVPGVVAIDTGLVVPDATPMLGEPVILGPLKPAQIVGVFSAAEDSLRYCYENELRATGALAGRVSVKLVIDKKGGVSASTVRSSTLGSPDAEQCISRVAERLQFPVSPTDGITIVTMPLTFRP